MRKRGSCYLATLLALTVLVAGCRIADLKLELKEGVISPKDKSALSTPVPVN